MPDKKQASKIGRPRVSEEGATRIRIAIYVSEEEEALIKGAAGFERMNLNDMAKAAMLRFAQEVVDARLGRK